MRIAYVGRFPYPGSTAPTQRVVGISTALNLAGHQVTIAPMQESQSRDAALFEVDHTLARAARSRSPRHAASLLLGGSSTLQWLRDNRDHFDVAIVYGTPAVILAGVLIDQRMRPLIPPVILDVVEWYEYRHRPGGRFGPFALEHAIAMRGLAPKVGRAICISSYLGTYFRDRSVTTITVPPLFRATDVRVTAPEHQDNRIHIGYAGSPGSKDSLGLRNLISAASKLPREARRRLCIEIVGMTQAQAEHRWGEPMRREIASRPAWLRWHGTQPHARAQELVSGFDFTYLQRPMMRYAAAGFPTKVVESLTLGTPIIGNLTSDLARYVRDGQNGVVLNSHHDGDGTSEASVGHALNRILSRGFNLTMSRLEIRSAALSCFDPIHHSERLGLFIRQAVESDQRS